MPSESLKSKKHRAGEIIDRLLGMYPDACCSLSYTNPYEILVATILSAQCTDERVNKVTPALFARYPDAAGMAMANRDELIELIRSTGFFNNKSKNLIECCQTIVKKHRGVVPDTLEELTALPGVGRKTANVVLGEVFHIPGVVVDTHVGRISRHLGLTAESDPVKIEFDLMKILPQEYWTLWNHMIIDHGRAVCTARKPMCSGCKLCDLCPGPVNKDGHFRPKPDNCPD